MEMFIIDNKKEEEWTAKTIKPCEKWTDIAKNIGLGTKIILNTEKDEKKSTYYIKKYNGNKERYETIAELEISLFTYSTEIRRQILQKIRQKYEIEDKNKESTKYLIKRTKKARKHNTAIFYTPRNKKDEINIDAETMREINNNQSNHRMDAIIPEIKKIEYTTRDNQMIEETKTRQNMDYLGNLFHSEFLTSNEESNLTDEESERLYRLRGLTGSDRDTFIRRIREFIGALFRTEIVGQNIIITSRETEARYIFNTTIDEEDQITIMNIRRI